MQFYPFGPYDQPKPNKPVPLRELSRKINAQVTITRHDNGWTLTWSPEDAATQCAVAPNQDALHRLVDDFIGTDPGERKVRASEKPPAILVPSQLSEEMQLLTEARQFIASAQQSMTSGHPLHGHALSLSERIDRLQASRVNEWRESD